MISNLSRDINFSEFQSYIKINPIQTFSNHPSNMVTHASVLLLWNSFPVSRTRSFVELGCGTGFISLGMSKFFDLPGYGIDIQYDLEPFFKKGVEENHITSDLIFKSFDISTIKGHMKPESTDLCIFNPPHYISGRGEQNLDSVRELTRNAEEDVCDSFSKAAAFVLKTKGYFSCIITPQNLENWVLSFRKHNLSMKSIIPVYGRKESDARLLLIKGLKNGGTGFLKFRPPVFLV